MITGTDVIIPVRDELEALDVAIRHVIRLWDDVVLEDAEAGEVLPTYAAIRFSGRKEILAFRDTNAAKLWDELGPSPSLNGTLIHFLISPGELTVAVDDVPGLEIASFIERLQATLMQDIFASTAELQEAA